MRLSKSEDWRCTLEELYEVFQDSKDSGVCSFLWLEMRAQRSSSFVVTAEDVEG